MQALVSVLDQAYCRPCRQRREYPPDADVWHLCSHWDVERVRLEAGAAMSDKLRRRPLYRKVGKVSEFHPKEVVEESKAYYEALT